MNREQYEKLGRGRIVRGDLFTCENVVVPIKTEGRWYGSISQHIVEMVPEFPRLVLTEAKVISLPGKNFVFVAFWDDDAPYSWDHIRGCTQLALLAATHANLKTLAFPLLGGNEGHKYIGAMEAAIDFLQDTLEPTGMIPPEVIFVER